MGYSNGTAAHTEGLQNEHTVKALQEIKMDLDARRCTGANPYVHVTDQYKLLEEAELSPDDVLVIQTTIQAAPVVASLYAHHLHPSTKNLTSNEFLNSFSEDFTELIVLFTALRDQCVDPYLKFYLEQYVLGLAETGHANTDLVNTAWADYQLFSPSRLVLTLGPIENYGSQSHHTPLMSLKLLQGIEGKEAVTRPQLLSRIAEKVGIYRFNPDIRMLVSNFEFILGAGHHGLVNTPSASNYPKRSSQGEIYFLHRNRNAMRDKVKVHSEFAAANGFDISTESLAMGFGYYLDLHEWAEAVLDRTSSLILADLYGESKVRMREFLSTIFGIDCEEDKDVAELAALQFYISSKYNLQEIKLRGADSRQIEYALGWELLVEHIENTVPELPTDIPSLKKLLLQKVKELANIYSKQIVAARVFSPAVPDYTEAT